MIRCLLLLIVWTVTASAVAAQRGPAPDPLVRGGTTVRLAAHTYAIPDGGVGGVPNVGIVVGNRAALVVDFGLGRRNGETVLGEAAALAPNLELYLATTHYHPEHTTGSVAFPSSARYVNARVQEAEFDELGQDAIERFASRTPVMGELLKDARRRPADMAFDDEYTLDLGGVRVRMLAVGPTHTRGDIGIFVEGDGVLFSGDVVMNESFVGASAATSMRAWLAAFDAFDAMRPTTVVPSHGPIGDGSLIDVNRTFMVRIQTRARELKTLGRSADEAATTIQQELRADHPTWGRINGVAAAARAAYAEAP